MRCHTFHKIFLSFLFIILASAVMGQNINNMQISVSSESLTVLKFNSRITHVEFGNREAYTSQVRDDDNSLVIKTVGDTAVNTNLYVTEGKRGHLFNVVFLPSIDINNTRLFYDFSDLKKLKKLVNDPNQDMTATNTTPERPNNNTVSDEEQKAQHTKDSTDAAEAKKKADIEAARLAKAKADSAQARKEEDTRLAKAKADAEAAQKAEELKLAKAKADAEAAQKADELRLAKAKADEEAAQKLQEAKLAKAKADAEAAQKAEEIKQAKVEADKAAAQKAEDLKLAKAKADAEAAQQAEAAKLKDKTEAAQKAEELRLAKAKADAEAAQKAEEIKLAKAKTDSIQKAARQQAMQAKLDTLKQQKARNDALAKARLDSIQAQKERNAKLAQMRLDSIQAKREENARIAKARLDSIQARKEEIIRIAAERKKHIEDSLAALPEWYTHIELWKKYPHIVFEDPPDGQHLAGDYFLTTDTLENARVSYLILNDTPAMQLPSNLENGVQFTLQGIYFSGVNCFMRIHIENKGKSDYLTGIMNLRWNVDSATHYDAYPCFITSNPSQFFLTSFPVLAAGVDKTIVLTTRALNVKKGDSLLLTIGDRLDKTKLELSIPVEDYLSVMEHTK